MLSRAERSNVIPPPGPPVPNAAEGCVLLLNQCHFLLAAPGFDLLFPSEGGSNVAEALEEHQPVDPERLASR